MRAIVYLTLTGIVYLIAVFTVPAEWVNTVQLLWLFITALALWFPPLERLVFPRIEPTSYTVTTDTVPTTAWVLEAKFRELSDQEILDAMNHVGITGGNLSDGNIPVEWMKDFARTVVRKAQER